MKRRRARVHHLGFYPYLLTIPDRLYPFASTVQGNLVRGKASYDHALALARRKWGPGHFGTKVFAYRQVCHLFGAFAVILVATAVSREFFGSDIALKVLLILAIGFMSFQEFYLHPRYYGQLWRKSVSDWAVWILPIGLYFFSLS